jgi:ureidoacrylate peracid hydrolase
MSHPRLPPETLQRVIRRRGKLAVFEDIDPASTALIVVDMQNFFVASDSPAFVPTAAGIVPNINRLAAAIRSAGGHVVWLRITLSETGRGTWRILYDNFMMQPADDRRRSLLPGSKGHAFWPGLDIQDPDLVVDKDRFSPFVGDASELERVLRDAGIDTVLIAGTMTNVCCESTARDAMMLDFRVIMVDDANAAPTDEDHLAGLHTLIQVFADVADTEAVIARIGKG